MSQESRTPNVANPPTASLPSSHNRNEETRTDSVLDTLPFYRIPAPPIPGRTGWSVSSWLPE